MPLFKWRSTPVKRDTAVFIAGNAGIFFPALVALDSIERHNPNLFDRYMCFEKASLTPKMARTLKRHGIKFIDTAALAAYERAKSLWLMAEGKWPVEIFINWALPEHLGDLGYKYAIKFDYDVLCIHPFGDLRAFLNDKVMFSAIKTNGAHEVPTGTSKRLADEMSLASDHPFALNAGGVFFNTAKARNFKFFDKFARAYSIIVETSPFLDTIEQVALAVLSVNCGPEFKVLSPHLNHRVRQVRDPSDDFTANISVIHYVTRFKPWLPFNLIDARKVISRGWEMLPYNRNLWLEAAMKIDGFKDFTSERPLSSEQLLCVAALAARHHRLTIKGRKPSPIPDPEGDVATYT